jgi:hypothetical protein
MAASLGWLGAKGLSVLRGLRHSFTLKVTFSSERKNDAAGKYSLRGTYFDHSVKNLE